MILINIAITTSVIGLIMLIIGKITNKRKVLISGISILLLIAIGVIIFIIYAIEKEEEQLKSQNGEEKVNEQSENLVKSNNINTQSNNNIVITTSGTIKNIHENIIETGTYIIKLYDNTQIKDYETKKTLKIEDLHIGDSIYVEGEQNKNIIDANKIQSCSKQKIKEEVSKYLKDTYRVDGLGIEYVGDGYIIVDVSYENFIYPLKINVNSQTETFLGMGYHIQSNYGYVLHEMCNITLDTKITDIDNIQGFAKTIEYIAD